VKPPDHRPSIRQTPIWRFRTVPRFSVFLQPVRRRLLDPFGQHRWPSDRGVFAPAPFQSLVLCSQERADDSSPGMRLMYRGDFLLGKPLPE
jgi:hypothetical protein